MAKQGKLFSANDAASSRALIDLMSSIDAIPIRTLKPSKDKGGLYLVRFHANTSTCLISRLPSNIIRLLISYNTVAELLTLSLTCTQFSKFLFDKYVQFSGELEHLGLYRAPTFTFQDHFDLHRLEELKDSGKKVKIYGSIKPEFTSIFYVNSRANLFYSYYEGAILEGTFQPNSDTLEIKSSRPCISNVTMTDVSGNAIACASVTALALSLPTALRQVTFSSEDPPVAIHFIASKRMILVQRVRFFDLYHSTLELAYSVPHEGWLTKLYLPDPTKPVFATVSAEFVSTYAVAAGGQLQRKFRHERAPADHFIADVLMHRHTVNEEHYDFLILLRDNGEIVINFRKLTDKGNWRQIYLCDGHLIALNPSTLQVFSFSLNSKTYIATHTLRTDLLTLPCFPSLLSCSRMKVVSVDHQTTDLRISYYQPSTNLLKFYSELYLPVEAAKVVFNREIMLVKGVLRIVIEQDGSSVDRKPEEERVPCVYVINFNADSMIGGAPDLLLQAREMIEEKNREIVLLEIKKLERKQRKHAEKAKKHEEATNKHRPKH